MIALIGATGTIGFRVAVGLAERGLTARALVRRLDRGEGLRQAGMETVEGDISNPASLALLFEGVQRLFLATPPSERMVDEQTAVVDAAVRAGVGQVVKVSALGADPASPIRWGRGHGEIEQAIRGMGIGYTFLRPAYFMQNFLRGAAGMARNGVMELPVGEARVALIDARDIADVAVRALSGDEPPGQSHGLTGPDALTGGEIAAALGRALGCEIRFASPPPQAFLETLLAAGLDRWNAEAAMELYAIFAQGYGAALTPDVEQALGRPPISFARFAEDHAQVMRQAGA